MHTARARVSHLDDAVEVSLQQSNRTCGFASCVPDAVLVKIPLDLLHQVTDEISAAHLNMLRAGPAGDGEE